MIPLDQLKVQIFADGADKASMLALNAKPYIRGLTTNPTLMRKAGVVNYRSFAREVLAQIKHKPVCFEVLADDFSLRERGIAATALVNGIRPASIDFVVERMAAGWKTIWH